MDCEAQIASAERSLAQVSLAAALSEDATSGSDVVARLTELRSRKELLISAMLQAEAAERANLGRLNAREHEARKRSLSQKAGQLRRDQQRFTAAACEYRDAYRSMVQTAASITALLPSQQRDEYEGMLSQGAIKKLCEVESFRVSQDGLPCPGVQHKPLYSDELAPLADTIEQRIANLKEGLEKAGPVVPGPAEPAHSHREPEPQPEPAGYAVDLRGFDVVTGEAKPVEVTNA